MSPRTAGCLIHSPEFLAHLRAQLVPRWATLMSAFRECCPSCVETQYCVFILLLRVSLRLALALNVVNIPTTINERIPSACVFSLLRKSLPSGSIGQPHGHSRMALSALLRRARSLSF